MLKLDKYRINPIFTSINSVYFRNKIEKRAKNLVFRINIASKVTPYEKILSHPHEQKKQQCANNQRTPDFSRFYRNRFHLLIIFSEYQFSQWTTKTIAFIIY